MSEVCKTGQPDLSLCANPARYQVEYPSGFEGGVYCEECVEPFLEIDCYIVTEVADV